MDFKKSITQHLERKYVQMLNREAPIPYTEAVGIDNSDSYSEKREKYYSRLSREKNEFNQSVVKITDAEAARLGAENDELERIAMAKFRRTRAIRTILFILPVIVAALVGLDVFTESHGHMDTIQYDLGIDLGWIIFFYVLFCLAALVGSAILLNISMYSNEMYIDRTTIIGKKKYNTIAIVVFALTLIIVLINAFQLIQNLGKGKIVLVGADRREIKYFESGTEFVFPEPKKADEKKEDHFIRYTFTHWEIGDEKYNAGDTIALDGWYTATAVFEDRKWATLSFSFSNSSMSVEYDGKTISVKSGDQIEIPCGTQVKVEVDFYYSDTSFTVNGSSAKNPHSFTLSSNMRFSATSSSPGCIAPGTEIVLFDGTVKLVEELEMGDMLLVFNHESGKYEAHPLLANIHANTAPDYFDVIKLTFSNGKELKIIDEHGLFDKSLNRYVYLNAENAGDFIGHRFACVERSGSDVVTSDTVLESVTITNELTKIYNPASIWHINLVANDFLTLSAGMVNLFEYDENMKYDEEKMLSDIEKYGLFTYEDFKDYVPYEVYQIFPFKYYKVAISKGEFTYQRLLGLIALYNNPDSIR